MTTILANVINYFIKEPVVYDDIDNELKAFSRVEKKHCETILETFNKCDLSKPRLDISPRILANCPQRYAIIFQYKNKNLTVEIREYTKRLNIVEYLDKLNLEAIYIINEKLRSEPVPKTGKPGEKQLYLIYPSYEEETSVIQPPDLLNIQRIMKLALRIINKKLESPQ